LGFVWGVVAGLKQLRTHLACSIFAAVVQDEEQSERNVLQVFWLSDFLEKTIQNGPFPFMSTLSCYILMLR
jgi:hypothetical protein